MDIIQKCKLGFETFEKLHNAQEDARDKGALETSKCLAVRMVQVRNTVLDALKKVPDGFHPPVESFDPKYRGLYKAALKSLR